MSKHRSWSNDFIVEPGRPEALRSQMAESSRNRFPEQRKFERLAEGINQVFQGSFPVNALAGSATPLSYVYAVVSQARKRLGEWVRSRQYSGVEPYDLLNSPYLSGGWARRRPVSIALIQLGKRFGGVKLRKLLRVPHSKNPKALGLFLAGYCDLARGGEDWERECRYLKDELKRLRSPEEDFFCWGYDWDFFSLRGPKLPAYAPNAIATYFCASALLDMAERFNDAAAQRMAESAGEFFMRRLSRSVGTEHHVCFSYTPADRTVIYNSSALVGAFLARLASRGGNSEYLTLARRSMRFLASAQRPDGSWFYGARRRQHWIDHFHTGYNLCALQDYIGFSGDDPLRQTLARGYEFYKQDLFTPQGVPKYFQDAVYPIDIHSCTQAILTFCALSKEDSGALDRAIRTALWTIEHLHAPEGFFYYQRHRFRTNRTAYMRWGQAWTFRALARLELSIRERITAHRHERAFQMPAAGVR